jgi:hypothetical protein
VKHGAGGGQQGGLARVARVSKGDGQGRTGRGGQHGLGGGHG